MTKFQNKVTGKEVKVSKMKSKPHPVSHSPKAKPDEPDKPAKLVHHVEEANAHEIVVKADKEHKSVRVLESNGRKDSHKAEKKKKHSKVIKVSRQKKYKSRSEEMKDKHHKYKRKHKKRNKHRNKKERKKDRKLPRIPKEKTLKTEKPPAWKGIEKIDKHVVKAHASHRKTNYHPTVQQHWVTGFNNKLGITEKSKPNIKFALTWGRGNHQDLSYRPNGIRKVELETEIAMADELKHLIVKHRRGKFRARLKLHLRKTNNNLASKGNDHRKSRKVKNKAVEKFYLPGSESQHNFLLRKHKTQNSRENGVDDLTESGLKNENEKLIYSVEAQNFSKSHSSRNKARMKEEAIYEVRTKNDEKNNPSLHGQESDKIVNDVDFNELRQTVQEKALAKKNFSQKLNPFKGSETVLDNYAYNSSPIKNLINVTDLGETENLRQRINNATVKNVSTVGSIKPFQNTISKGNMSSYINGKQRDASKELVEGSSFDDIQFRELGSGSVAGSASKQVLSNASSGVISKLGNDARIAHAVTDVGPTDKLRQSTKNTTLEPSHKIISKENLSSNVIRRQKNTSTELVEDSSFDNFRFSELGSASTEGSALVEALSNASSVVISKLGNDSRINHVVIGSGSKGTGSASIFAPSSSLKDIYGPSVMGEDVMTERTGNDQTTSGVGSNSGFDTEELSTGSDDGFLASSSGDLNLRNASSRKYVTEKMNKKAKRNPVISSSGPRFKDVSAESGNSFNEHSSVTNSYRLSNNGQNAKHKGRYSRIGTDRFINQSGLVGGREFFTSGSGLDSLSSLSDDGHQASNVQVLNESGFEADGSSIESTRGLHDSDDSITTSSLFSENILGEEENGNPISHFEEDNKTKGSPSKDNPTNDSTDNGLYLPFSANTISGSSAHVSTSGSNPDNFSRSSGSGLNIGGEGDSDEETNAISHKPHSSGNDNVSSRLFPSTTKSRFYVKDTKQSNPLNHSYQYMKHVSEDPPTDTSQLNDIDWHDAGDNDSGFDFESSIQRGSGEYGSLESISSQSKLMGTSYVSNLLYPSRSSFDGERQK